MHVAAKINDKVVFVEYSHKYLNKIVAIGANHRATMGVIIETAVTNVYIWNSSSIDRTDIDYNILAIGRELRFYRNFLSNPF